MLNIGAKRREEGERSSRKGRGGRGGANRLACSGGGDGKAGVAGFFQQLIHFSLRFFHRAQKQKPVGGLLHAPGGAAGNATPRSDERLQVGGRGAHLAQHASLWLATLSGAGSLGSSSGHFF